MVEKPMRNSIVINGKKKGFGYRRELNSIKDFSIDNPKVQPLIKKLGLYSDSNQTLKIRAPEKANKLVDFSKEMSPIRDQGSIGSCTSFALSGLVEYFEKTTYKKYTPISTLFTYKATRNLMKTKGDTGAYMRSVMGSLALFGTPPEEYWEYDIKRFDEEPPTFCYAFASNYQTTKYIRLDHLDVTGDYTISLMKKFLDKKIPIMFGFTVFDSIEQANYHGKIPYPSDNEDMLGGHAIVTCGYDDKIVIENNASGGSTTGAFIIRNSWGDNWGNSGYGYLPYEYFRQKMADDCWTIISNEWIDHLVFQ